MPFKCSSCRRDEYWASAKPSRGIKGVYEDYEAKIPRDLRPTDFCSGCKTIRQITDFPLNASSPRDPFRVAYRKLSCATCLTRQRELYREVKGEVFPRRQKHRFTLA